MAGFEDLIRDTLLRQGEPTHANRARVYASARDALERMIRRRADAGEGDEAAAQRQREQLEAAIERIEDEHTSVAEDDGPDADPVPDPEPESVSASPAAVGPVVSGPVVAAPPARARERPDVPPVSTGHPAVGNVVVPDGPPTAERSAPSAPATSRRDRKRRERLLDDRSNGRPVAKLVLWLIVLLGIAAAAWWAWTYGPATLEQLGPDVVPARTAPPDAAASDAAAGDWITVFDPANDIAAVAAPAGAASDIVEDAGGAWLRVAVPPAPAAPQAEPQAPEVDAADADPSAADGEPPEVADGGPVDPSTRPPPPDPVRVRVPPGVLASIAGRAATFEATVRTPPDTAAHPFSVVCDFRAMGTCNRTRFVAQVNPQPFVFRAELGEAGGDDEGTLLIRPDAEGEGRAIDLGPIRVSVDR